MHINIIRHCNFSLCRAEQLKSSREAERQKVQTTYCIYLHVHCMYVGLPTVQLDLKFLCSVFLSWILQLTYMYVCIMSTVASKMLAILRLLLHVFEATISMDVHFLLLLNKRPYMFVHTCTCLNSHPNTWS